MLLCAIGRGSVKDVEMIFFTVGSMAVFRYMRNVRISVVCLLWLGVLLLGVQTASGQEDSTRVRRDSLRVGAGTPQLPVKSGISGVGAEDYRPEASLEARREVPVFRPVRRDPDLRLPYQENPSLRFKGDFRTEGSLWRWRTGQLYGTGSQTSLPGIGRRNEAAFSFEQELNDRLSLQATVDAVRMNMAYFNRRQSLGLSGALVYWSTGRRTICGSPLSARRAQATSSTCSLIPTGGRWASTSPSASAWSLVYSASTTT